MIKYSFQCFIRDFISAIQYFYIIVFKLNSNKIQKLINSVYKVGRKKVEKVLMILNVSCNVSEVIFIIEKHRKK